MVILKGGKFVFFVAAIVGGTSLALYPIIVDPMLNPEKYKKQQQVNRRGIKQEDIQPGNMKVWTDPFDRTKS